MMTSLLSFLGWGTKKITAAKLETAYEAFIGCREIPRNSYKLINA